MTEIYNLLVKYSLRTKKSIIDFVPFTHFALRSLPENKTAPGGDLFSPLMVGSELEALAENKKCELAYEAGKISTVIFPDYYVYAVRRKYKELEKNYETPFPMDSDFEGNLPQELIQSVNIQDNFLSAEELPDRSRKLYRIHFPEGVHSILVPADFLSNGKLMEMAVYKIKLYLNTRRNADYLQSKMQAIFRQRNRAVKDMFASVLTQTRNAISSITSPNDFSFQFWNHLSSAIIQEFKEKNNKQEKEHSYSQSAYIINHYNLFYKSRIQRQKEQQAALKSAHIKLRKSPYFFTLSDIYAFKDDKGVSLSKKVEAEIIHKFLEKKIKPKDNQGLPELLRILTENKKEYFICSETFIPLFLKKIGESRIRYREYYLEDWKKKLNAYRSTKIMNNEEAFEEDIKKMVQNEDPLLWAMMRYELVFLTLTETKPSLDLATEIERYMDRTNRRLKELTEIFGLDRREILKKAKKSVAIWKVNPILRFFAKLFLGLGKGLKDEKVKADKEIQSAQKTLGDNSWTDGENKSSKSSKGTSSVRYANIIRKLKEEFIGEGGNLDSVLADLREKWNPLFEDEAKKNLVEDVNSMIRDYLRKLKRGFMVKPPDKARIENIAEHLSINEAFGKIRRKEYFKKYIALYMLYILGQVK